MGTQITSYKKKRYFGATLFFCCSHVKTDSYGKNNFSRRRKGKEKKLLWAQLCHWLPQKRRRVNSRICNLENELYTYYLYAHSSEFSSGDDAQYIQRFRNEIGILTYLTSHFTFSSAGFIVYIKTSLTLRRRAHTHAHTHRTFNPGLSSSRLAGRRLTEMEIQLSRSEGKKKTKKGEKDT